MTNFLLALSDVTWQAAIGGIVTIALAWIAYMAGMVAKRLETIQHTGAVTHALVNSQFGVQLRFTSVALRRVASLTSERADVDAAVLAEKAYADHMAKQAVVDATMGVPPK